MLNAGKSGTSKVSGSGKKYIPYGSHFIDDKDVEAVVKALRSDCVGQGPRVKYFEDALCKYTGAKYAVCVSSGTAALHLACLVTEIHSGDEVMTSPLTFVASANCAIYCGGMPVFADIDEETLNIDPQEIEKNISASTKALIPVHFSGQSCEMEEISNIAKRHRVAIIEDAAHALGAEYKNSKIGSCKYSDMTIFSFHPLKSITTGEGGAVLTNNRDYYDKLLLCRNHGMSRKKELSDVNGDWYYHIGSLGYNYRLTDIQAALGASQLEKVDNFIEARRKIADIYDEAFKGNVYFDVIPEKEYTHSSRHIYPILLKSEYMSRRCEIFSKMRENGLGVQVHYIPVHKHDFYVNSGLGAGRYPKAERAYQRSISIPIYPGLPEADAGYVIETVFDIFKGE